MPFTPTISPDADATELRGHLADAARYLVELRARPAEDRSDSDVADARSAVDFIHEMDAVLNALERSAEPAEPESRGPSAAFADLSGVDRRSAGHAFVESEGYQEWRSNHHRGEIPLDREIRLLLTSGDEDEVGSGAGLLRPVGQPILPTPRQQRLFIRDVLTVQGTGLANIPYIREVSPLAWEGGASAVAEGSAKPEVTMQWTDDEAPVRKIAAWIPASTEILEDAPTLRGYIDTRLAYMLALREEQELINGPGTAPRIKGILSFSDVQTQAAVSGDLPATVGMAIGKVENVDGGANFVAVNPITYWTAVTKRHAASFDASGNGPAPSAVPNITWGLAPIRTRSMAADKALVGDGMGATIFDRRQTTIRLGDQHGEYFTHNKVAVLAEKRLALAVFRPDFFVDTTVPTS